MSSGPCAPWNDCVEGGIFCVRLCSCIVYEQIMVCEGVLHLLFLLNMFAGVFFLAKLTPTCLEKWDRSLIGLPEALIC